MNKCAKFHKDSPSDKKSSISQARLNFGDGRFCVQLCIETYASEQLWWHIWPAFPLNFFYEIFTEDASLLFLYQGAKKSKMTKNSNQGGPAFSSFCVHINMHTSIGLTPGSPYHAFLVSSSGNMRTKSTLKGKKTPSKNVTESFRFWFYNSLPTLNQIK